MTKLENGENKHKEKCKNILILGAVRNCNNNRKKNDLMVKIYLLEISKALMSRPFSQLSMSLLLSFYFETNGEHNQ